MKIFLTTCTLLAGATAHSIFQTVWVNGVPQGRTKGVRVPTYDGPIQDVNSNDVICNGGINPLRQPLPTDIITIPAGSTVGAEWHHTLTSNAGDSSDPIDSSHKGPVIVYLAKVESALTTTVTGLKWFKIYQDGLDSSGKWGVDRLIANKGVMNFKMPPCIKPGNYLMRVELIALHAAGSYPGAQLYMECAQVNVTGGGSATPSGVDFPGAYRGTDAGIKFNLYYPTPTTYTVPGPTVFNC